MKVYRDLIYRALDPAAVNAFLQHLQGNLGARWSNAEPADPSIARMAGKNAAYHLFARDGGADLPNVTLVNLAKPGKAAVVNIIPTDERTDRLTSEQYNAILDDFASFASPIAESLSVGVETNAATTDLGPWLSPRAIEKLEGFSNAANKSTGSAHPMDAARWCEFLIQAHREDSDLADSTLAEYLVEHLGWGDEQALKLVIEYDEARRLLRAYDSELRGA